MNKPVNKNAVTDERLVRSSSPEVRGDRGLDEDAARTNNVDDLSDAELDELVASEFEQVALPAAPLIPGFHLCWLTTMSKYDTLHKRERLGYTPVKQSEVPNFNMIPDLKAEHGAVTCNEMILYKIAEPRFQAIMRHFHHRRPLELEEAVVNRIKEESRKTDSGGRPLGETEGDGITALEAQAAAAAKSRPVF